MIAFFSRLSFASRSWRAAVAACVAVAFGQGTALAAPTLPEIRLSPKNAVPSCVTPDRLMAFLKTRNGNLDPRFRTIATFYKQHGEAWGVRWDYAFFQMAIETNFLTYRAPNGRMGDVDPKQNNFAGIGTTGGGVPGDRFPDVSTGVLGQIQHLVVYSGEQIANPVAQRTQLKQEHILAKSRELNRAVRFSDLARRWAADPKYGGSIEWVAEQYRSQYCKGRNAPPQETEVLPWQQERAPIKTGSARAAAEKETVVADADSPVRTVWTRSPRGTPVDAGRAVDKQPAPSRTGAKTAKAVAAAPVTNKKAGAIAVPAAPKSEPLPKAQAVVTPTEAAAGPVVEEPEAHFALFTPPAGLANATIVPASNTAPQIQNATSAENGGAAVAPLAVVETRSVKTQSVTVPPIARSEPEANAVGPPVAPQEPDAVAMVPAGTPVPAAAPAPQKPAFDPPSGLGVKPGRCVVETATFGGDTTVLVKTAEGADVHYVALSVLDGFEDNMTKSYLASRPAGGEALGTFPTRDAALTKARTLCRSERADP
ncbi:hypothetical protein [Hyphomicrobium sp.]|uniref:glucosaminidase domain-containing protein n=1 Tax=Hyphomicrobium sp. TaxID=82 RepID=UPI002E3771D0|nr:hypothetical protein [Hyphomicrobium sp.]HEX2842044.1 hypothetical protein [Hyphomicrobium sp.]